MSFFTQTFKVFAAFFLTLSLLLASSHQAPEFSDLAQDAQEPSGTVGRTVTFSSNVAMYTPDHPSSSEKGSTEEQDSGEEADVPTGAVVVQIAPITLDLSPHNSPQAPVVRRCGACEYYTSMSLVSFMGLGLVALPLLISPEIVLMMSKPF